MDFVLACVMFAVFSLGGVLAFQGIVGKELDFTRWLMKPQDFDHPRMVHPPERHRLRLVVIGIGLMVAAVVFGIIVF